MRSVVKASILASTIFAALSAAACSQPVLADESNLTVGHGVVCDTADEVKAVVAPVDNDLQKRLLNVNEQYGEEACNM
jgi:hypothetical protein